MNDVQKTKRLNKKWKAMEKLGLHPPKDYEENRKRLNESRDFPAKEKHDN